MAHQCQRNFLQKINNQGAELIEQQEYVVAIEAFTEGLKLVRKLLNMKSSGSCSDETIIPVPVSEQSRPQVEINACDGPGESADCKFLYTRPIIVQSTEFHLFSFKSYAFMFMFNLALSHHLYAISKHSISGLWSALELYELAYELHLQENIEVPLIHSCAIVNNIGQIQRSMNDGEAALSCFNHLLSILMMIVEGSGHSVCSLPEYFVGFFHNVSSLILQEPLTAPAA